jgi:hypothetical protein
MSLIPSISGGSIKGCGTLREGLPGMSVAGNSVQDPEGVFPGAVEHINPYGQEGLHGVAVPAHRLVFVHAFSHHLVNGGLREGGRDGQARPVTLSVIGQERGKNGGSGGNRLPEHRNVEARVPASTGVLSMMDRVQYGPGLRQTSG